jgi:serine/threonine protein kinase/tetratricopeptide (TPR) repeat protein
VKSSTNSEAESSLFAIADAINNGLEVDWDSAESSAPRSQRPLVHLLREVSRVASAYKEIPQSTPEALGERDTLASNHSPTKWGSLEIITRIGAGAFGEVYRARDQRLDRHVALKLFHLHGTSRSQITSDVIEEGRLLARVHHPNVVTVHGADHIDGRVGIWMEIIEGATLEEILAEQGPLSAEDAMVIGRDLCRGLVALHESGVIHRDIKSRNVMRETSGRVVLMDLGVSCDVDREMPVKQYGTPLYAAPEVLLKNQCTLQSDIYSVGVLLYHLVTGDYPISGLTLRNICNAHQDHRYRSLREVLPELPDTFIRIVEQAMAPNPVHRFETAVELEQALSWALGEITQEAITRSTDLPSIAVLPFDDFSPNRDQEYICEGLAEALVNALLKTGGIKVAAHTSASRLKRTDLDILEIGKRLRVKTVLEGSVYSAQDRLRITARLSSATDGFLHWSETYDCGTEDIFAVQESIAQAIVENLIVELLSDQEGELVQPHTSDIQAYNLYMQGRYFWHRRDEGLMHKAIGFYQQATARDPDYAPAHAGIANCLNILSYHGFLAPLEGFPMAKAAANKALALDDSLSEAYASLGWISTFHDWDFVAAEKHFKKAIELNPRWALARLWYSLFLGAMGRFDEALTEARLVAALDPFVPVHLAAEGLILYFARRFDEAISSLLKSVERDPASVYNTMWLGVVSAEGGQYEEGVKYLERASQVNEEYAFPFSHLGWAYAQMGEREKALDLIARLESLAARAYVPPTAIILIYIALGEIDKAFDHFEEAFRVRDAFLVWTKVAPSIDPVRPDPRFQALIEKMGFPESEDAAAV